MSESTFNTESNRGQSDQWSSRSVPVQQVPNLRRWQTYTGKPAMLAQTNRTFQEIETERQRTRSAAVATDLPTREAR